MAIMPNVSWKKEAYSEYKKMNAQTVYTELRNIGKNNPFEQIPNQDIVDFARANIQSELHKGFNWNDFEAAEAYRRDQARHIKNSLVTFELTQPQVKIVEQETIIEIPAFINPGHDKLKEHAPTEIVMVQPELRKATLEKALKELQAFQKKYHYLNELAKVFDAINQVNIP